jgi:hypothetical protein
MVLADTSSKRRCETDFDTTSVVAAAVTINIGDGLEARARAIEARIRAT